MNLSIYWPVIGIGLVVSKHVIEGLVNKIRVLLANHSMMISDVIRNLVAEQEDMEVVGDFRGPMRILQEVGKVKADVVVLAQEGAEELGLCSQLLDTYPDLIIVSLVAELDIAFIQQLRSHRERVATSEQSDILQSMRRAVHQPCGSWE